jgi:hypothetical protein
VVYVPLQRFGTDPVVRPAGRITSVLPLTGVTELRLHGVGGTPPEDLLEDAAPQHVSGDRIAGFYRTADQDDRHIEAYSWGGLTSRSGSRVLWLLLLPFALANVAGWMCTARTFNSSSLFGLHRTFVRWAALGVTINLLLITAITSMDLAGYQCGAQDSCAGNTWLLHFLRYRPLADYPSRRVLVGALVPFLMLAGLAALARLAIGRYESVNPPFAGPIAPLRSKRSAAAAGKGLDDATFWDGQRSALDLGCLHVAAGVAVIAMALAHTVHTVDHSTAAPVTGSWLWTTGLSLGAIVVGGVLVSSAANNPLPGVAQVLMTLAVLAMAAATWFAVIQPRLAAQPVGPLPGMRNTANLTIGAVFAALALVLLPSLLGWWQRGIFVVFGPFMMMMLGMLILNVVGLGVLIRVADWLGTVHTGAPSGGTRPSTLYVYEILGRTAPYITLLPVAVLLIFGIIEGLTIWRAGTTKTNRDNLERRYEKMPRPSGETEWRYSTVEPTVDTKWLASVARAEREARIPRDADKLVTTMIAVAVVLLGVLEARIWLQHRMPWDTSWTLTLGSWLAAGAPLLFVLLLRNGWRSISSRRHIGVIWDVCTFWPRAYHPLAPPSYAERAVPDLQRRLWRIHSSGGRVVIAAHSQGSIIAAAALLQPDARPADNDVALVTFGSPLRNLYGWAFPAYFNDNVLQRLTAGLGTFTWRNFYYRTDFIGGAALAVQPTEPVDKELPDPINSWHIYGQPKPVAGRHSGYWNDPAVWRYVQQTASHMAARSATNKQRQPLDIAPAAQAHDS